MNRFLYLTLLSVAAASTLGCQSTNSWFSGCGCFRGWNTGYRGAPCNTCAPSPCACPNPCSTPVYTQSIPAYGGDCGCSPYGGFVGMSDCGSCGGGCTGGCGGTQFLPGTVVPGEGMIIDGGQIPSLPGGTLAPQTVPAPQTTPIPQATPGPAPGN